MARASSVPSQPLYGDEQHPGDWQALRGELVALLDQVEGQYARTGSADPAFAGFAERMRDLRFQVADVDPADRHREALRSVKRQIDRFNDRGEPETIPHGDNVLQSAIQQIRARTQTEPLPVRAAPVAAALPAASLSMPSTATSPEPAGGSASTYRFDDLAQSMAGVGARLEQLETELRGQRGNASQVREIADQVSQLSHVVELLAGAVGETGQVKRLEGQIAGLAELISQGPKVDLGQLSERLDQVAATVDRLADLQVQQIQHVVREAEAAPNKDGETVKSMQAIEAGVRNIYDRIDTLESSVALPPAELERIGELLGHITQKLGNETARPDRLLGLVDALNGRINEIEDRGEALAGLKGDVRGLRDAVLSAVEPRFAAIETQLGAIGEQLAGQTHDGPSLGQLEAQIRQLVARMDQTGEQLTGLASLYAEDRPATPDFESLAQLAATRAAEAIARNDRPEPDFEGFAQLAATRTAEAVAQRERPLPDLDDVAERAAAQAFAAMARHDAGPALPDLNALADMVASRTAEAVTQRPQLPSAQIDAIAESVVAKTDAAMTRRAAAPMSAPVLSDASLAEIEARIGRLVDGFLKTRAPEAPSGMREGIDRVEERLGRLETSLSRRDAESRQTPPPAMSTATAPVVSAAPALAPATAAPGTPAPLAPPSVTARPAVPSPVAGPSDTMPRNPNADAPLKEFGFPDLGPVRAALGRKLHPGMDKAIEASPAAFQIEPVTPEMASPAPPARAPATAARTAPPPAFDPTSVVRPPQPESSLGTAMDEPFAPVPAPAALAAAEPVSASSRNTFIEAARRSAQRQNAIVQQHDADSLIGRALSRFQPGPVAGKPAAVPVAPEPVPPPPAAKAKQPAPTKPAPAKPAAVKAEKAAKLGLFARKPKIAAAAQAAVAEPAPSVAEALPDVMPERRAVPKESFLARHRKPILIAASLIAVSFMTLNLVMQRLAANDGNHVAAASASAAKPAAAKPAPQTTTPAVPVTAPVAAPKPTSAIVPQATPAATTAAAAPAPGPRIVPTDDPVTTASIGPSALNYVATPAAEPLPPALAAANSAATASPSPASDRSTTASLSPAAGDNASATSSSAAPTPLESPVKVDLPPDTLGPLELRQAAADGDARSQFEVAAIYSEGRAIPQDDKQAAVWYERAAAQGFAPAQYRLGNLYETGSGVAKDYEQARLWYQRAAEAGNRMAMHNLAALYAGGQFGKQDFVSAANWFEQAADRGMKDSQFNLGMLYARGLGVPQSLETSYKWFALAASTGDADAAKARDNIARSLDAATLKQATGDAAGWKETTIDLAANFAPIGTWQKDFNPGPAITSKDVISKVQTALTRLGFDIGTPNGHLGAKTSDAIKAFERGTGMTEVGAVNPRLLAVLGSQPV